MASGKDTVALTQPGVKPSSLEVTSIITHGQLASCDGWMDGSTGRIAFSHVFRFASTSKSATIKEARAYLVEIPG